MKHIQEDGQRMVMKDDGQEVAEITCKLLDSETLVIDHTFVSEQFRGQKIGDELVRAVVDKARNEGKRIVPACSFALAQFKRHKEYADVWQQD